MKFPKVDWVCRVDIVGHESYTIFSWHWFETREHFRSGKWQGVFCVEWPWRRLLVVCYVSLRIDLR